MEPWQKADFRNKKWLLPGILILGLLGAGFGYWLFGNHSVPEEENYLVTSQEMEMSTSSSESRCFVDIKGAVVTPGVYQVNSGARVLDVVAMAGGLRDDAAQAYLNLAEKVVDQQLIYVLTEAEVTEKSLAIPLPDTNQPAAASEVTDEKVNINTADATQLQTLSGIGIKKAEAIIAYREEHGPFSKIEDLQEVSGIGEKTVEKLRASITI